MKQNKKTNHWVTASCILAVILVVLIVANFSGREKTVKFGDLEIKETDLKNFEKVFGDQVFVICDLEEKKCYKTQLIDLQE